MKNGILLLNKVFYNIYKIIGVHLHKGTIMNQFHIYDFYMIDHFF
jgi:hypothetical protein